MPVSGSLPIGGDQLRRERRQLLGDQEGIAAAAHIQHPVRRPGRSLSRSGSRRPGPPSPARPSRSWRRRPGRRACQRSGRPARCPFRPSRAQSQREPAPRPSPWRRPGPGRAAGAGRGRAGETTWRLQTGIGDAGTIARAKGRRHKRWAPASPGSARQGASSRHHGAAKRLLERLHQDPGGSPR